MLTSLRPAAALMGLCSLLCACGDPPGSGSPPEGTGVLKEALPGVKQANPSRLLRAKVNGLADRYIVVFDELERAPGLAAGGQQGVLRTGHPVRR